MSAQQQLRLDAVVAEAHAVIGGLRQSRGLAATHTASLQRQLDTANATASDTLAELTALRDEQAETGTLHKQTLATLQAQHATERGLLSAAVAAAEDKSRALTGFRDQGLAVMKKAQPQLMHHRGQAQGGEVCDLFGSVALAAGRAGGGSEMQGPESCLASGPTDPYSAQPREQGIQVHAQGQQGRDGMTGGAEGCVIIAGLSGTPSPISGLLQPTGVTGSAERVPASGRRMFSGVAVPRSAAHNDRYDRDRRSLDRSCTLDATFPTAAAAAAAAAAALYSKSARHTIKTHPSPSSSAVMSTATPQISRSLVAASTAQTPLTATAHAADSSSTPRYTPTMVQNQPESTENLTPRQVRTGFWPTKLNTPNNKRVTACLSIQSTKLKALHRGSSNQGKETDCHGAAVSRPIPPPVLTTQGNPTKSVRKTVPHTNTPAGSDSTQTGTAGAEACTTDTAACTPAPATRPTAVTRSAPKLIQPLTGSATRLGGTVRASLRLRTDAGQHSQASRLGSNTACSPASQVSRGPSGSDRSSVGSWGSSTSTTHRRSPSSGASTADSTVLFKSRVLCSLEDAPAHSPAAAAAEAPSALTARVARRPTSAALTPTRTAFGSAVPRKQA
ncbi:MAG: hypothetical protein WDW38_011409 [Sanguina aurantia]